MRSNGKAWRFPGPWARPWAVALVLLQALGALSCAGLTPFRAGPDEEALRRRVELYWQALQQGDGAAISSLTDPDLREKAQGWIERIARGSEASRIQSWRIDKVLLEGHQAVVVVSITSRVQHPLLGPEDHEMASTVTDHWVYKKGRWFVVVEEPSLEKLLRRFGSPAGR